MRIAFLSRRPRLLAGAAFVIGVGALALYQAGEAPAPDTMPAPTIAAPTFAPPVAVAVPVPSPVPAAASTSGLQLRGVLGYSGAAGSAIFGMPDGRQRLVAVGREVAPGVRLESIGADRATVHDGVRRLELMLPELQAVAGATPAAPMAPTPVPTNMPTPTPTPVPSQAEVDPRRDLANFRLGLKPVGDPAQPSGYRVADDVPLPMLDRAGLEPGDVVLAVNGQTLDEERLLELPAELLAATSVVIEYERGGKRQRATVPTR